MRKNNFIMVLVAMIFAVSNLIAQSPEPDCPFTDPCLDNQTWGEEIIVWDDPNCLDCQISLTYLVITTDGCIDENGNPYTIFAFYLDKISYSPSCLLCYSFEQMNAKVAIVFKQEVLDPVTQGAIGPYVVEFKLRECYTLQQIATGEWVNMEPCENLWGCCEYRYFPPGSLMGEGWFQMDPDGQCEEFDSNNPLNTCFSICQYFGEALTEDPIEDNPFKLATKTSSNINGTNYFTIAPNPITNEINLSISELIKGNFELQVVNLKGEIIFYQSYSDIYKIQISSNEFANGTYLVNLIKNDLIIDSKQVVINK